MKQKHESLDNITWETAEQAAVTYPSLSPEDPGPADRLRRWFPARRRPRWFTPANGLPPDEAPDADYP